VGQYAEDYLDWVEARRAKKDESFASYAPKFWMSSVGTCPRQQVLNRAKVSGRPMTRNKIRFFADRTAMHDLRIQGWWDQGRALTADVEEQVVQDGKLVIVKHGFSLTKYLPEDFGGRPDIIGHRQPVTTLTTNHLRFCFQRMVGLKDIGDSRWTVYRDMLREAGVDVTDNKTANPNLVNYSASLPKKKDIGQTATYAHCLNDEFGLGIEVIRLVYTPVGSASDDLEYEIDLPSKGHLGIEADREFLVASWGEYLASPEEDPWKRPLPSVLDLVLEPKNETYQRQGVKYPRNALFVEQSWECGYCKYAGLGCTPKQTKAEQKIRAKGEEPKGTPGDRVAVARDDRNSIFETTFITEWCRAADYVIPEGVLARPESSLE
jgi:hypothetical protein